MPKRSLTAVGVDRIKAPVKGQVEYFDKGYRLLELDPANDQAWHNVWRAFKAGGGA